MTHLNRCRTAGVVWAALTSASAGAQDVRAAQPIELLDFATATSGDALPPGWTRRVVRREAPPSSSLSRSEDGFRWIIHSAGAAAWFGRDLHDEPLSGSTQFELTARIPQFPAGADLAVATRNDAAFRFFVVFENRGRVLDRRRMVMYSFGPGDAAVKVAKPNRALCDLQMSVGHTGAWRTDTVSPSRDALRYCDWRNDRITAIGFLHDTDQLRSPAAVELRHIRAVHADSARRSR